MGLLGTCISAESKELLEAGPGWDPGGTDAAEIHSQAKPWPRLAQSAHSPPPILLRSGLPGDGGAGGRGRFSKLPPPTCGLSHGLRKGAVVLDPEVCCVLAGEGGEGRGASQC